MTKTITNAQIIGSQGESFVAERANAMGFMFTPYGRLEAGIDGVLEVRDPQSGTATGRLVAVQVKTKARGAYTDESEAGFEYLMDESGVTYWRDSNLPVVVVLVHLECRTAYWKSVSEGSGSGKRRLRINKETDVFDETACDDLAALCVAKGGWGVSFPPLRSGENGHLNLLEVLLPKTIFVGASPFKSGGPALRELLEHDERPPDDWVIRGGQFISFRDPRDGPLAYIVDVGSVEPFDSDEITFPDDESDEHTIIDLLRRTLTAQLDGILAYSRPQRAFFFAARHETIKHSYFYRSLKRRTSTAVVQQYKKDDKVLYVRHHAFEPRFWRIGNQWYLSITPTFVFTWDGFRPDRFGASRLAGKKKLEHQAALTGQFVMWRHLLIHGADGEIGQLFDLEPDSERLLDFQSLEPLVMPRSVPEQTWKPSDPFAREATNQMPLGI